jgi:Fe-S cluster assembly protein SufD
MDSYVSAFEAALEGNGTDWLAPVRRQAMERFRELGFPTTRLEDWKYTNVRPLAGTAFRSASPYRPDGLSAESLKRRLLTPGAGPVLAFVDGAFAPDLSKKNSVPEGVLVLSLAEAMARHREKIEPSLTRLANTQEHAFTALNTAFLRDGACLIVPDGKVVEEPVEVVFLSRAGEGDPVVSHPRLLIVAGARSQVTVLESYAGVGDGCAFSNAVTEIDAGAGAVVEHYKIQRENIRTFHVATIRADLGRDATYTSHSISEGAALARNDLDIRMNEEGGDCTLNGLYIVSGKQHVDNHTLVDHAKPHCSSRELYKGVLAGSARGVFDGKVIVRPDAQKSDARQVNSNLLLSDQALVDTKPQLEINADDVKCAHAATIGQLDPEAIFYMRSRALSLDQARTLLIHGFVHEMIDKIRIGCLRTGLEGFLYGRLGRHAEDGLAEIAP